VRRNLWREWRRATAPIKLGLDKLLLDFADWNAHTAAERQVRYNVSIVRRFIEARRIGRPDEIVPAAVDAYLAALRRAGFCARTLTAHRNSLGKFCRFLQIRGELEVNAARMVEVRPEPKRPPRYLTSAQIHDLLCRAIEPAWIAGGVRVALWAGLRLGEIMTLCWGDVGPKTITVGGSRPTKTRDFRIVPLKPELAAYLGKLERGPDRSPIFERHGAVWWNQRFRRLTADLPPFGELPGPRIGNRWHLLRSTWAVNCARAGATLWQLMAWGGWKTPQTVMRYINVARAATPPEA